MELVEHHVVMESLLELKLVKMMILTLQMVVTVHAKQFQDGVVIQQSLFQVVHFHVGMGFEIHWSFVMI